MKTSANSKELLEDKPVRLRGHHLTNIGLIEVGIEKEISLEVYGKEHFEYVDTIRQKLLSYPNTKIEIVEGYDDICNQCRLLETCKKSHNLVTDEYERAYRKITGDNKSEFYSSNLAIGDKQELRRINRFFIEKDFIRNIAVRIGLKKSNYYTFIDLVKQYNSNNRNERKRWQA